MRSAAVLPALVAAAAALVGLSAPDPAVSSHVAGTVLLPDLQTRPLADLSISTTFQGQRLLRFSNEIANLHTGPLELFPVSEDCDGDGQKKNDRAGYQRIYIDADGNGYFTRGVDAASTTVKVGCFVNHPQHHHWHIEDFASYRLYAYGGGARGAVVGASDKVSFCVIDYRLASALPGAPASPYYTTCERADTEGISVGWSDVYGANLSGQSIDVTGLPDGTYCLASVADPLNRITETDDANNETSVKVTIAGTTVAWQPYEACPAGPATPDTSPPTAPGALTATGSVGAVGLTWTAATDDRGVAHYNVHRSTASGFVPSAANRVAQPSGTSYTDTGLTPGTYYYLVTAEDAAGNVGPASNEASAEAAAEPPPPPPTDGLVAAYGFEEASGTSATDASGNGNTGTISGAARTASGRFGSALSFDGTDDWVTVADAASLDLTTGMTLEAWVNASALTGVWRTVIIKQQTAGVVYSLYADTDTGRPAAQAYTSGESTVRGTSALALNTWTHLAATYDGTTLRLYVNGALVADLAVSGTLVSSDGPLRIGGNSVWSEYFKGVIDEVRVYSRALTQAEIQNDMDTAVAP